MYSIDLNENQKKLVKVDTIGNNKKVSQFHCALVGSKLYVSGGFDGYKRDDTYRFIDLPISDWTTSRHYMFDSETRSTVFILLLCFYKKKFSFFDVKIPKRLFYYIIGNIF